MKNKRMTILITLAVVIALFSGCSIDINPSVANTQFGMQALHYAIYHCSNQPYWWYRMYNCRNNSKQYSDLRAQ